MEVEPPPGRPGLPIGGRCLTRAVLPVARPGRAGAEYVHERTRYVREPQVGARVTLAVMTNLKVLQAMMGEDTTRLVAAKATPTTGRRGGTAARRAG
jgi:hypothetical protein